MERPNAATVAWYEAAVPDDPRAVKGQMFSHPCAFVNRNMFFGTFAQSVVARIGEARTEALAAKGPGRVFEPMPKRAWREYLQLDTGSVPARVLKELAIEALENTARLPPKPAKGKAKAAKAAPTPKAAKAAPRAKAAPAPKAKAAAKPKTAKASRPSRGAR